MRGIGRQPASADADQQEQLVRAAVEWMASVSIALDPEIIAAMNFAAATSTLATRAA
jgi:hypothetical protein